MTNVNWDEVGYGLIRRARVRPLENFKEELNEAMVPLIRGEGVPPLSSMDVMVVLIFISIDFLGYLYKGRSLSTNAVSFIREYLGRLDSRYQEVGGLLYHLLRHGWIHKYTPQRLKLSDGTVLDFTFGGGAQRKDHLSITKTVDGPRLLVSLYLLYNDLNSAIDLYLEDLRKNQELFEVFEKAFAARRKPEAESDFRQKAYFRNSDLQFILSRLQSLGQDTTV